MTLELSPRLRTVAGLVPEGCRFADIGTDHAYLPVWLLRNGVVETAIAGDLRPGPLAHARETAERFGCTEQIQFRLSDGLAALAPHEADCIAMAGMGGETVRGILSAAPWTRENVRLLLQPQSNLPELREWLTENGYAIWQEYCVREEQRWYTVLVVLGGESDTRWTPGTRIAGRPETWAAGCPWGDYLRHELERLRRQREGLLHAARPDVIRLDELTRAENELEQWQNAAERGELP
ncbi:MAG: class I SAM-dependent methyltransferase [Clostridiales bacterium]|nr:class I SAM-dependent methyltransferase [Clostridiales bacterium]